MRYTDDYYVLVTDGECLTDGDVTVVKLKIEIGTDSHTSDLRSVYGSARRDPGDKSDPETGVLLAYGRAFSKLGRLLERRADGRVRHADGVRQARRAKEMASAITKAELTDKEDGRLVRPKPPKKKTAKKAAKKR